MGMVKDTDKAYIAGLIDGEGTITIGRRRHGKKSKSPWYYQPIISMGNTNRAIVDFIGERYSGWVMARKPGNEKYKEWYQWFIRRDNMISFLQDILPYLRFKRPQAEIVLQFPTYRGKGRLRTKSERQRQDYLYGKIVSLNPERRPRLKEVTKNSIRTKRKISR